MTSLADNFEHFLQVVKRLSSTLDTVRISNLFIRYLQNVPHTANPFGQAVLAEAALSSDLLHELILNNSPVLDGTYT
jgi:hypothetical protein